jgi:hypothetical protein
MKNLAKLFKGKETKAEEDAEMNAYKSGKITKKQFIAGEKSEGKSSSDMPKLACGGKVKKMSEGGMVARGGGAAIRGIKFTRNG